MKNAKKETQFYHDMKQHFQTFIASGSKTADTNIYHYH